MRRGGFWSTSVSGLFCCYARVGQHGLFCVLECTAASDSRAFIVLWVSAVKKLLPDIPILTPSAPLPEQICDALYFIRATIDNIQSDMVARIFAIHESAETSMESALALSHMETYRKQEQKTRNETK